MYSKLKHTVLLLIVGFLLLLLSNCKNKENVLAPKEYVAWVEDKDNGLRIERLMNPITYTLQYKPYDYVIAKEERSNTISKSTFADWYKELDKMQYYTLRIEAKGVTDILKMNSPSQQEYYQRQNYLTYEFQGDIQLVDGTDTIPCDLFQMVGNYGLAPYIDFVIGFKSKDAIQNQVQHDKQFILEDKIFGGGILKFIVKKEDINKIPEIKKL